MNPLLLLAGAALIAIGLWPDKKEVAPDASPMPKSEPAKTETPAESPAPDEPSNSGELAP